MNCPLKLNQGTDQTEQTEQTVQTYQITIKGNLFSCVYTCFIVKLHHSSSLSLSLYISLRERAETMSKFTQG